MYSQYGTQCGSNNLLENIDSSVNQLRGLKNSAKDGMRDIDQSIYDLDDELSKDPDKGIREAQENAQGIKDSIGNQANYAYNAMQCARKMSDGCANSMLGNLAKNANNLINAAMTVASLLELSSTKGKLTSLSQKILAYGALLNALGVTDLIKKIDELIGCSSTYNDIKPDVLDQYIEDVNYIQDDLYLTDEGDFNMSNFLDKKMDMFSSLTDGDMVSSLQTSILDSTDSLSDAAISMKNETSSLLTSLKNEKLSSNVLLSDWF